MSKDGPLEGSLAEVPFPRLLFEIWREERSGGLRVRRQAGDRAFYFDKGWLIVARESFDEAEFLAALVRKKVLQPDEARQAERRAALDGISRIKAVGELGHLSAVPLWSLIESYFVRRLFGLFDGAEGAFAFDPAAELPGSSRFGRLEAPDLVLQGVRQMHDAAAMDHLLPGEDASIQVSTPFFFARLGLEPHERYAFDLLRETGTLRHFRERSELSGAENRKVLFAFACLGILAEGGPAETAVAAPGADQARVLEALNEKCAYIFRYVTKEIGPVARTVLNRSLDEVRPALGSIFQKMDLQFDGRVEVDAALRLSADHLPEELFRSLVRGYDEILMAEVLAVKKTLGGAHETALVRNLEKVGCN